MTDTALNKIVYDNNILPISLLRTLYVTVNGVDFLLSILFPSSKVCINITVVNPFFLVRSLLC